MAKVKTGPTPHEKWLKSCPLRQWLAGKKRGALIGLARETGINVSAFGYWMRGQVVPRAALLAKLKASTGITMLRWYSWMDRKPT